MDAIVTGWADLGLPTQRRITRCTKCASPLVRKPGMFFWRGERKDGAGCEKCNALWALVGEEIKPLRAQ